MGAAEDKAKADVIAKLRKLAKKKQTTPKGLFRLYDQDGEGELSRSETKSLLSDADIGGIVTRAIYVRRIFEALDKDESDGLSLEELDGILQTGSVPPPAGPPAPPKKSADAASSQNGRGALAVLLVAVALVVLGRG